MDCKNCGEEIEEKNLSRSMVYVHKAGDIMCNKDALPKFASATPIWTIDHRRMEIIEAVNRGMDEFSELKKEIFYWDNKLKCATTKKHLGGRN